MKKEHTDKFFNRELSWIEFNARVLHEAKRQDVPLAERLKFLGIVSSNFDEFFMVRVAGLKRQAQAGSTKKDIAGMTAQEQLAAIAARTHQIVSEQYGCLMNDVLPALAQAGIVYVPSSAYTPQHRILLRQIFDNEVFPLLTPLRTGGAEQPHLNNRKMYAAFKLVHIPDIQTISEIAAPEENPLAIVQIPTALSRIIWLPAEDSVQRFALLEDIIAEYGTALFPGYTVQEKLILRATCDAAFAVDEEAGDDFIQAMEEVLVQRQTSVPVSLMINTMSSALTSELMHQMQLTEDDVFTVNGILDIPSLTQILEADAARSLAYPPWNNFYPVLLQKGEPLWDILKQRDILLHVPYESYEPVISFLNDAAADPDVLAIKMTLYRTSGNSPIIRALENAAHNGKQVTVFVELKARFDEKQNISWAEQLERAGVIVVYGIVNLKVHAKILLVVRREHDGICRYIHLSTGNYNDKTARFYVDMSLFTANRDIANDATQFFNIISGYSAIQTMKRLAMAPLNIKSQLLSMIEREIQQSTSESPGLIMAKMNSLAHHEIIEALYRASRAGVRVMLNVRGICMLIPGVSGMSENISVISIIDRYLEHTRIFYFHNGGSEEIYLSSADWMPRNLDRRVELMFPVIQQDLFKTIKSTLVLYFSDNCKSHTLHSSGKWTANKPKDGEPPVRAQETLYNKYREAANLAEDAIPLEFIIRRSN